MPIFKYCPESVACSAWLNDALWTYLTQAHAEERLHGYFGDALSEA